MRQRGATLLLPTGGKDPGSSFSLLRRPQSRRLMPCYCFPHVSTDTGDGVGVWWETCLLLCSGDSSASCSDSSGSTPAGPVALLLLELGWRSGILGLLASLILSGMRALPPGRCGSPGSHFIFSDATLLGLWLMWGLLTPR